MGQYSRRRFLRNSTILGAGMMSGSLMATLAQASTRINAAGSSSGTIKRVLADLHVHPTMNDWLQHTPAGLSNPSLLTTLTKELNPAGCTWKDMHAAGIDLICASHFNFLDEWLSMPTDPSPIAPDRTRRMMNLMEADLDPDRDGKYSLYGRLVRSGVELDAALAIRPPHPDYRIAVVHSLEGGHVLGGDPEQIEDFAQRGVAYLTVAHFFNKGLCSAANSFPFFPDAYAGPAKQGLSELGAEVISEMERCGMLVDITHMTSRSLDDVLPLARRPLIASHTSMRVLGDHPYSLHDDHALTIARNGGLIGVIVYPYILSNYSSIELADELGSIQDVVDTILYLIDLCGDHHSLAIGTDYGGFIHGPREMPSLRYIDRLTEALRKELPNDQIVQDIMADNLIGFLKKNWGTNNG